jgi:hypothetical protein
MNLDRAAQDPIGNLCVPIKHDKLNLRASAPPRFVASAVTWDMCSHVGHVQSRMTWEVMKSAKVLESLKRRPTHTSRNQRKRPQDVFKLSGGEVISVRADGLQLGVLLHVLDPQRGASEGL